ncbi:MAG: FAD-dependent oxidoreductase [Candidatus Jordarchaeales archaeon]|nr:FAD-dependent oxidoreductase [Candidatus Jordarchaeia archaeon]
MVVMEDYDVIVIGGGSTGTSVARDCAMRGFRTILFERGDLASGATGACAGMISGGTKYVLQEPEFSEMCTREVVTLSRIAGHIVFRTPIITAILTEEEIKLRASFVEKYGALTEKRQASPILILSPQEARSLEPKLSNNIILAAYFDEMFIDPFRLTVLTALSAKQHGAEIRTYTEVVDVLHRDGEVYGVRVKDRLTGRDEEIRGRIVVNAAGAWVPEISRIVGIKQTLRLNKGAHVVFDRRITRFGIICRALDGRTVYLFPHETGSILGTTAIDIFTSPDEAEATYDEIEYLISSMEMAVPSVRDARIVRVMCGVRPLIAQWWVPEGDVTRNFRVIDHEERDGVRGLVSVEGGKLVVCRAMAEKITDLVCEKLGREAECRTHLEPLPGADGKVNVEEIASRYHFSPHTAGRLISRQGTLSSIVLSEASNERSLLSSVCLCEAVTEAELRHVIRNEWGVTLDALRRRTRMGMGPCQGFSCGFKAMAILAEERGMGVEEAFRELERFLAERWRGHIVVLRGSQLSEYEMTQAAYACVGSIDMKVGEEE